MTPRTGGATPHRPEDAGTRRRYPGSCLGARLGAYAARARLMDELAGRAGRRRGSRRPESGAADPVRPMDA